jgi:hypothetical protein
MAAGQTASAMASAHPRPSREIAMETRSGNQRLGGFIALGALLVVAGIGAFAARQAGIDPIGAVADAGWPFFVIGPGVALLIAALLQRPPKGLGFAIAGGIVTTVGLVLFYQQETGHWESWAYAWALVGPGAAGVSMLLYGLLFGEQKLVVAGLRLALLAGVLFTVGFWYFETIFDTGSVPFDVDMWWPVALVVLGAVVLVVGLLNTGRLPESGTREAGGVR